MEKDLEHLGYLKIAFYIFGGLIALFSLFPLIYVVFGVVIASGSFAGDQNPPPPIIGFFFVGIGSALVLLGFSFALLNIFVGKYLGQQKKYLFCFVIGALNCLVLVPFGTVLGVFTIIVLVRDSVKQLFGYGSSAAQTNAQPGTWR